MADRTELHLSKSGAITCTGDAVVLYQWVTLRAALRLWVKSRMPVTRGMNGKQLLARATAITHKKYVNKENGWLTAIEDLDVSIETLRASIPVTHED